MGDSLLPWLRACDNGPADNDKFENQLVYLFRPRPAAEGESELGTTADPRFDSFGEVLPSLNTAALQPGSAAEWAIAELLIRLCNRGRALRPEPPEAPVLE
jgi:hypothetical protein